MAGTCSSVINVVVLTAVNASMPHHNGRYSLYGRYNVRTGNWRSLYGRSLYGLPAYGRFSCPVRTFRVRMICESTFPVRTLLRAVYGRYSDPYGRYQNIRTRNVRTGQCRSSVHVTEYDPYTSHNIVRKRSSVQVT